jgi:hypothetical protein
MNTNEKEYTKYLNQVKYVEDLENVPKPLLSNSDFIEGVLLKLGKREDFTPDMVMEYVDKNLLEDPKFLIGTFFKVISLHYTNKYLYENYFESISYFYDKFIRPLLKDEVLSLKLIQGYNKLPILKNADFLEDVKQDNILDTEDDGSTEDNIYEFLIRNTLEDTKFKTPAIISKIRGLVGKSGSKFLPEQFVNSGAQQILNPDNDNNSNSENQPLFSLTYYLNEENPEDKERVVYWLLPSQPFKEHLTQKLLLTGYDVLIEKTILKELINHPLNQITFKTEDGTIIKFVYHSE